MEIAKRIVSARLCSMLWVLWVSCFAGTIPHAEASTCSDGTCPGGQVKCWDECVDLDVDADNCGACDDDCIDGRRCVSGRCVMTCPSVTPMVCYGGCFDFQTSPLHCGSCGNACAPGESCVQGLCSQPFCLTPSLVGGLPILEQGVVSGPSLWEGSCGGLGPEAVFSWTAPQDGYYIFDTKSSSVDTVLYLKTGGCYGLEVGCDDDIAPGTLSSEIRRFLSAGETVTIFVDSFNSGGSYQLNISQ